MAELIRTNIAAASIATPAAGTATTFVDTDRKVKSKDEAGVVSILVNDGLHDRSVLINGGFRIQQRVATASTAITGASTTTRAGVVADRWAVTSSVVTATARWAQIDTAGAQDTGLQSRYYGSMICDTAARKFMLSQWVIGSYMAHLRGKKVRLSIKLNQKVGTGKVYKLGLLQLTVAGTLDVSPAFLTGAWSAVNGTDPVWGTNLAVITPDAAPTGETGTITGNYLNCTSVATTWTRYSCVFTIPTNAKNLVVVLFDDTTGGATDNISVAEFQMTEGPEIVDFIPEPLSSDLRCCQQFYCKSFPQTVVPAASVAVATGGYGATFILGKAGSGTVLGSQIPIQFPVVMWKAPVTVTLFTSVNAGAVVMRHSGVTPAVQGATAVAANSTTDRGCHVTATNEATTNGVIGDLVSIHYTADAEIVA